MSLKRTASAVLAALTAAAITTGTVTATIPANAATVTPAQVAGQTPVGTIKLWDAKANPPMVVNANRPQEWTQQVDHKTVLSYLVHS